jgi:hypothetical protein
VIRYFNREAPEPSASAGWFVDGRWYANSAAKFWAGILDEVASTYPEAHRLELEACVVGPLTPDLLDPRASLQRMFDTGVDVDAEGELRRLVEELELLGPPGSVTYRITTTGGGQVEAGLVPEVDAEILAHLAAWLLEWAHIDHATWNDRRVDAGFAADRPKCTAPQTISFTLNHSALHEGLYRCHLTLFVCAADVADRDVAR